MSLKIKDIKIKGYERVIHATNEITKLDCIIAIHNTKLGPALGGVRSWEYNSFEDQKKDALRLSEAMTLKNSICGINFGGGKASINLSNIKKTPELYQSYAEAVETLNGTYLTAGDVNTFKEDLIECSKVSKYVYGINLETSGPTSRGLFYAMKSALNFINNSNDLENVHVAISGVGKVGGKLAKLLSKKNAKITVASINNELVKKLKSVINITEVHPQDLFKTKCDIISPCALGGAINESNKNQLKCRAIVGAANNQLENPALGEWLIKNNIVYSPDYLVNSGGVIAIASEINKTENLLEKQLEKIGNRLKFVLEESKKKNEPTNLIAKRIAWERINS
ncbi:MAG: Glu/Leu/Phe/Val dehydrogenase [Pelagibacteraceae bacterium]|nr:Glu/Leu/Phe/Val dehydrogenase [Pelagibacteraceae bacterium]MBO6487783.1 Glu/Leu/Phe/Val dehydrogenase [Pelagibacteraceae bacterium]